MASYEARNGKKERVMIVDDHAPVRRGLRSILEAYPDLHIVGEASNGVEAILLMEKLYPSIIIMDINMPRMNGIEATARIKHENPHTVIIGLSVNTNTVNQEAMQRAGAVRLIPKEQADDLLYDVIHEAVRNRKSPGQVEVSLPVLVAAHILPILPS